MFRRLGNPLAAVIAMLAVLVLAPVAQAADDGKVRFTRNAKSSFDPILTGSTLLQREWMASHYWRMRGYAPFFNQALPWAPPSHFYKDLYAIYTTKLADQQLASDHPDWVLRDASGNRLFIQYNCNGTSCSQWAADIGNPAWRAHWISKAQEVMGQGYDGIFVDDVNLLVKVSNASGTFVRPMDPRTGAPMTDANWRRYMAEFTEEIKAAFPDKEVVHNPLWWLSHSDPHVQRQVDAADMIEMERGFNDGGIVNGTGTYGYETLLAHVDWLHSRGASALFEPSALTATSAEFELASYYLVKAMEDTIVSDYKADPGNWWTGWDTDLGTPAGKRYVWNGLIRRDFADGMVLVNQPGATTKAVTLPSGTTWRDLSGNPVTTVTLGARQAKVLRKAAATPPPPPPPPDTNPPDTNIIGGPSGTITTSGTSFSFTSTEAGSSFSCRIDAGSWTTCASPKSLSGLGEGAHNFEVRATDSAGNVDPTPATRSFTVDLPEPDPEPEPEPEPPTIKPGKGRVKKGERIALSGSAPASARLTGGAATVTLKRKQRGGTWQAVRRVDASDGTYRAKLVARRPGTHRYRATAPSLPSSRTVRVRVVR